MSFSIPRRARYLTLSGLATLALAAGVQVAVTPAAMSADTYTIPLHQKPPILNSAYSEQEKDCGGAPGLFGWHFVLPQGDVTFVSLTVTFANAGVVTITEFGPPSDKHAYVYTPTDDTLLAATAVVTGDTVSWFNLSHVCAGSGVTATETPTPTPTVSATSTVTPTPSESVSETPSETPSATVSATVSVTPSETVSETPSETPSATVSATVSVTPSETVSETPSETPSATVSGIATTTPAETPSGTPTESATVLPTRFTNTPEQTVSAGTSVSPSVRGVRQTRGPVRGTRLPNTGTPMSVMLLVLAGFGLLAAGVVTTAAPAAYVGRHRR